MANGESMERIPNGPAVAAYLAAMVGVLGLAISAYLSERSETVRVWVHGLGKLWMPGAEGIGPYSGKETIGLVAWLGAWLLLGALFRRRQLSGGFWVLVFVAGIGVATTLVWPPVAHFFGGHS